MKFILIFPFLDLDDHFNLRLVCKEALEEGRQKMAWRKHLKLVEIPVFNGIQYLERLTISMDEEYFNKLQIMTSLKELNLVKCGNITNYGLKYLQDIPINKLQLRDIDPYDKNLITIRDSNQITDDGLNLIKDTPINYLDLKLCNKITNNGLLHIKNSSITHLSLWFNNITNLGLIYLLEMKSLTHLNLHNYNITDEGLFIIRNLQLKKLSLCINITDEGLSYIKNMPLQTLKIYNIYDVELFELQNINPENINLHNITWRGFKHIKEIKLLTYLELYLDLDIEILSCIKEIKTLTHLNLGCPRDTLPSIGLVYLKELPLLKRLSLAECAYISSEDVFMMEKILPNCKIED